MTEFVRKNYLEILRTEQSELESYYRELRKYECENDLPVNGIEWRKKTYQIVKLFLAIDKLINLRTVKVVGDERTPVDNTKVYTCTHIGRFDIESAIEALNEAAWFIMGDPKETYKNLNGLILRLYGVSWFDMGDGEEFKYDAHTVNVRQQKILLNGGNELCFPEQAWNLDPIIPVGEIHPGPIKRAIKAKSVIIPTAIEQYRGKFLKHYYVNLGKNIDVSGATLKDVDEITEYVRSEMTKLKWEIWEKYGFEKRKNIAEDWEQAYNDYIDSIMCDSENGYTIEEIERTKYRKKVKVNNNLDFQI